MDPAAFEAIAAQEFANVPERFAVRIKNVALLIEDEPDEAARREERLGEGETLLALYRGVPATARGDYYSGVLPDTITLYREPLIDEAETLVVAGRAATFMEGIRLAVRETLWHEIGHYFGMGEESVHAREDDGTNYFK